MSAPAERQSPAAPRSWLFVPGDSERKQARGLLSGADALILDLEDSVAAVQLPAARERVTQQLRQGSGAGPQLWVRINARSSGEMPADLAALFNHGHAAPRLAGLVLPKLTGPAELIEIAHELAALEVASGARVGSTRLLPIVTETPAGLLSLPAWPEALAGHSAVRARLVGLTWGSEDLGAALGSAGRTDASGALTGAFSLARTLCLLTAAALGVSAVDGVYVDFRDAAGLADELEAARRDGFTAKLAIHPEQVAAIQAAFTPSPAQCEWARRVLAAFAAAPQAGVVSLDGRMIDRPHLIQARRILARSGEAAG